jgi:hypothetical protein
MPDEEHTALEFASSSDRLLGFFLALCGACVVFGGWAAALSINQSKFQTSMEQLQAVVQETARQATATAIQTRTYQESAISRDSRMESDIDRLTDLLNQLVRESN